MSAVPVKVMLMGFNLRMGARVFVCACVYFEFALEHVPLAHTSNILREERKQKQAAGCFHQNMSLKSTASEQSNDHTLAGDGNVGINGIPRGGQELQVVSRHSLRLEGRVRRQDWKKL
ncbi:hypothetical protein KUCAC02_026025 [Chaenocephalus aceratus]|uniref:Uncharacterized protein n=1 Tax=Chaenocephalus aceratus TaxID=36190 RepID=A0ACB9VVY7_CHAAC|nr:hypothetical protein KUCAC02_026025 [Chaenocephalus aceratus]